MKKTSGLALLTMIAALGCNESAQTNVSELRTIDNSDIRLGPVEVPPSIADYEPERKPKPDPAMPNAEIVIDPNAKKLDLPYAPAIAMDPVDGSKVSLSTLTPIHEYKKKFYYFSSAANKQQFVASPETFLKGGLAKY